MPPSLVKRIESVLKSTDDVFRRFAPGNVAHIEKKSGDPLTEVDLRLDELLRETLLGPDEGWLSEETKDDAARLKKDVTWVVDPLDGTREFVEGLPEYCVSIAAVVDGRPVAGGVYNPAAGLSVTGAVGEGVFVNEKPIIPEWNQGKLSDMSVLASRSEVRRGEWQNVEASGIHVIPMGSVAYKMARVAVGLDDATWTLIPKHEWDVAGGAALLASVGGTAVGLNGRTLAFNRPNPLLAGVIAVPPGFERHVPTVLGFLSN